jgi:nitroreductase
MTEPGESSHALPSIRIDDGRIWNVDALEAIMSRRSIRRYEDLPITDADVEILMRAAMAAPSAANQQSWRFVVVTDRAQLDALSTATPYATMLARAPLGIAVCGECEGLQHPRKWQQDTSAATENILLAARATGLGGVWIGVWPDEDRVANVRGILGLPEGVDPMCLMAIGHPAEEKPPADRYRPDYVHHDRW